jgi:hypothetical protein
VTRTLSAKLASLTRHREPGDPDLARAREELDADHLRQYVAAVADRAPALTPEQRDLLVSVIAATRAADRRPS